MQKKEKNKRILEVIKIILIIIFCLILYTYLNKKIGFQIPCIFHKITNLYCPGCGVTRMLFSIIKLDFYQAFRYNPLIFIYFPFIVMYVIYKIYVYINDKKDNLLLKIPNSIIITILIITILFGILRNFEVFSYLRPIIIK